MAGKNTAVFGIYKSGEHAERAVDALIAAGYANADISVLLPDTRSTKEFAHEKSTKAPEGKAAGVTAGGVGEEVTAAMLDVKGNQVRLGIHAPKEVAVHRGEVFERIRRELNNGAEN